MFPVMLCKYRRCLSISASSIILLAAIVSPHSMALAEQPVGNADASRVQFDVRFVPREQRKAVPYELVRQTAVFRAQVGGREAWALLDNRVTSSLIDAEFARSLGLQLRPAAEGQQFTTPTGEMERWRVSGVDIGIPGQIGMVAPVSAIDLSRLSAFGDRPISLVIGKEYFDDLVFVFTPGSREFQLGPSGSLRLPSETLPLVLQNDRPQIEVMVAGRPAVLTVDLGYSGDIALRQDTWDRLGMSDLPLTPRRTVNAGGVVTNSFETTIDEASLGSMRVKDVKVALTTAFPDDRDGLVGFGLLSRFNFAIDIKARRLWLIPPFPAE